VQIEDRHAGWASMQFTYANFADFARRDHTLEELAAYRPWLFTLGGGGEPESVDGYRVSAAFFEALGVRPLLGRILSAEDDQAGGSFVVLSHGLWKRRFGSDAEII